MPSCWRAMPVWKMRSVRFLVAMLRQTSISVSWQNNQWMDFLHISFRLLLCESIFCSPQSSKHVKQVRETSMVNSLYIQKDAFICDINFMRGNQMYFCAISFPYGFSNNKWNSSLNLDVICIIEFLSNLWHLQSIKSEHNKKWKHTHTPTHTMNR